MSDFPLAYHFTVGTYGTRLHGDERGTVDRTHHSPGEPIIGRNDDWHQLERSVLRYEPIVLTTDQRLAVQTAVPLVCVRGGWRFHIAAAQRDHIHILLSASVDGEKVRPWLRRWLSQELSNRWSLPEGAVWWAECGSVKWVWTQEYYENVYNYILEQITTRP